MDPRSSFRHPLCHPISKLVYTETTSTSSLYGILLFGYLSTTKELPLVLGGTSQTSILSNTDALVLAAAAFLDRW
jgi:hypothetical protein